MITLKPSSIKQVVPKTLWLQPAVGPEKQKGQVTWT